MQKKHPKKRQKKESNAENNAENKRTQKDAEIYRKETETHASSLHLPVYVCEVWIARSIIATASCTRAIIINTHHSFTRSQLDSLLYHLVNSNSSWVWISIGIVDDGGAKGGFHPYVTATMLLTYIYSIYRGKRRRLARVSIWYMIFLVPCSMQLAPCTPCISGFAWKSGIVEIRVSH